MPKVRVGIVGCGGYSGVHARRLKLREDVQIVALCDNRPEAVKAYRIKNLEDYAHQPRDFTDLTRMLNDVELDAAVIATPHTLHFEHCKAALEAGCHVLVEKPMVTALADAYALQELVDKTGKLLVIGYNTPCTPEFKYLRDLIRKEELGKLELITGYISQGWMKGTIGTWRQQPELSGGGQAYDSGAHLLNSLCWTVEADVSRVFALADFLNTPVDINSAMTVEFANGVLASMTIGGNCPTHGTHMVYLFDNGRVEVDGWGGNWINVFKGKDRIKYPPVGNEALTPDDNFIDAILGKAEPRTQVRNGIIQSQLMEAVYESIRTGQPASPKLQG